MTLLVVIPLVFVSQWKTAVTLDTNTNIKSEAELTTLDIAYVRHLHEETARLMPVYTRRSDMMPPNYTIVLDEVGPFHEGDVATDGWTATLFLELPDYYQPEHVIPSICRIWARQNHVDEDCVAFGVLYAEQGRPFDVAAHSQGARVSITLAEPRGIACGVSINRRMGSAAQLAADHPSAVIEVGVGRNLVDVSCTTARGSFERLRMVDVTADATTELEVRDWQLQTPQTATITVKLGPELRERCEVEVDDFDRQVLRIGPNVVEAGFQKVTMLCDHPTKGVVYAVKEFELGPGRSVTLSWASWTGLRQPELLPDPDEALEPQGRISGDGDPVHAATEDELHRRIADHVGLAADIQADWNLRVRSVVRLTQRDIKRIERIRDTAFRLMRHQLGPGVREYADYLLEVRIITTAQMNSPRLWDVLSRPGHVHYGRYFPTVSEGRLVMYLTIDSLRDHPHETFHEFAHHIWNLRYAGDAALSEDEQHRILEPIVTQFSRRWR